MTSGATTSAISQPASPYGRTPYRERGIPVIGAAQAAIGNL